MHLVAELGCGVSVESHVELHVDLAYMVQVPDARGVPGRKALGEVQALGGFLKQVEDQLRLAGGLHLIAAIAVVSTYGVSGGVGGIALLACPLFVAST